MKKLVFLLLLLSLSPMVSTKAIEFSSNKFLGFIPGNATGNKAANILSAGYGAVIVFLAARYRAADEPTRQKMKELAIASCTFLSKTSWETIGKYRNADSKEFQFYAWLMPALVILNPVTIYFLCKLGASMCASTDKKKKEAPAKNPKEVAGKKTGGTSEKQAGTQNELAKINVPDDLKKNATPEDITTLRQFFLDLSKFSTFNHSLKQKANNPLFVYDAFGETPIGRLGINERASNCVDLKIASGLINLSTLHQLISYHVSNGKVKKDSRIFLMLADKTYPQLCTLSSTLGIGLGWGDYGTKAADFFKTPCTYEVAANNLKTIYTNIANNKEPLEGLVSQ